MKQVKTLSPLPVFFYWFLSLLLFYDDVSHVDSTVSPRFFLFDLDFASSLCPPLIYGLKTPT